MASTLTGSVAEIRDPKAKLSLIENWGERAEGRMEPLQKRIRLVEKMATKVPRKENIRTVPMFLKNDFFSML